MYKDKDVILFNGDCLEVMGKMIERGVKVDCIITSPPYNAKKEYEQNLSLEEYKKFAKDWVSVASKLLTENGSLWINLGYIKLNKNETLPLTYLYYNLTNLPLIQEIVWHYEGGMSYKKRFTHRTEKWMWFCKNPNNVTFNLDDVRDLSLNKTKDKRNNPLGKNPTDYWYFNRVVGGNGKSKEKKEHPCQFPEKMIERIVKACSNKNDLILDCFMGSGTTGVVCKNLERKFIGIELDTGYYNIAKERINEINLDK